LSEYGPVLLIDFSREALFLYQQNFFEKIFQIPPKIPSCLRIIYEGNKKTKTGGKTI